MKIVAILGLASTLGACSITCPIPVANGTEALLAADQAFADLSEATSAREAFAEFMAPDGIMMPPASDRAIEGYAQVMALFGDVDDPTRKLLWQPQYAEVAQAGDMGWTWGTWQSVVSGVEVASGKYVNVWKRQPDGTWKVRVDVGNQKPDDPSD